MACSIRLAWAQSEIQRKVCPGRAAKELHCSWATWLIPCHDKLVNENDDQEHRAVIINRIVKALKAKTVDPTQQIDSLQDQSPYVRVIERKESRASVRTYSSSNNDKIQISLLTARFNYHDIMTIEFEKEIRDGNLVCHVQCLRSGVLPCVIPGSALLNLLLFFVPFHDRYETAREIDLIRCVIERETSIVVRQVIYRDC